MRTEEEILRLVLDFARGDDRIRAVLMQGSRVNPNAPRDPLQDYDIVCLVTDVQPFRRNPEILRRFGEILIHEVPEEMDDPPPARDGTYGYLMQFRDGTRIDLGFSPLSWRDRCVSDTLTRVLLDKDGLIGEIPPPGDRGYLPLPPTAKRYGDCCTEFWWLTIYVAKGLWRNELTYARHFLDTLARAELMKMLEWYVGVRTDFGSCPGKMGKYLRQYLEPELWSLLERTYADALPESSWRALLAMGELFRAVSRRVADHFRFEYAARDDAAASGYILRIRGMAPGATSIPA